MEFVRIAVNLPAVSGVFDYHLPPELEGRVSAGCLVRVPFGAQAAQGVVIEAVMSPAVPETKPVEELIDPLPVLSQSQIELARKLAARSLYPLAAVIELMLPPGLSQRADGLYSLPTGWRGSAGMGFPAVQKRLLELLEARGPLRGRQIDRHFGPQDWRKPAQALIRQSILRRESILPPPTIRPKFIRTARLAVTPAQAEAATPALGKTGATLERRQKALAFLVREPAEVAVEWVYAESGCSLVDLQELAERELIFLHETEIFRDPLGKLSRPGGDGTLPANPVKLTDDQQAALENILAGMQTGRAEGPGGAFLLHGVTGSGKTELYLQAAAEALRSGKGAIILVPEIALTAQTVRRFVSHFPGQVGLVHSRLSDGERYDTWRRVRSGQLKVIIGARSALFTPMPEVGLIVVDECHDNSYYQSEPPFYHAAGAAEMYAQICGAVCVLGSATPPVTLNYRSLQPGDTAGTHGLKRLELPRRFQTSPGGGKTGELPPVSIVDMREELKAGNRSIFSRVLSEKLAETLERGEQAILYLNRRGTATYVFCRDCGWVIKCPRCDNPLTYHVSTLSGAGLHTAVRGADNQAGLVCHFCGYVRRMPETCPNCGGRQVRAYGLGSEKVESDVKELLPMARVLRWDWETTREKDAHELILTHFSNHQADVLVGTQMLAKGLDLPLVTLVGIVLADVGLTLPDPFANERAFQLLTQVAGRAGRSERGGRVILQTFMAENPTIRLAAGHDYQAFYRQEIENRRSLGYPPFTGLMRLEFRHANAGEAEKQAHLLAGRLKETISAENRTETSLVGPVPPVFKRINTHYRWQILVRGPDPASILHGRLPEGWRVEVEPVSLL